MYTIFCLPFNCLVRVNNICRAAAAATEFVMMLHDLDRTHDLVLAVFCIGW